MCSQDHSSHRERAERILLLINDIAFKASPAEKVTVCDDPDDNCFLECADAARAAYVVTGNMKHFPQSPWRSILIVTARELLNVAATIA